VGCRDELAMKTTILAYVIALGGIAMIVFGLWGLYTVIRERVAEFDLRDYLPPIQTIAVGLVSPDFSHGVNAIASWPLEPR